LDATVGAGGHSRLLLQGDPEVRIIAFDRDDRAITAAQSQLAEYEDRVEFFHSDFREAPKLLKGRRLDGVLADLGVSSLQLDDPESGFSFRRSGPLDMRMDRRQSEKAADLVNRLDERELARIIRIYGEERHASRIAAAMVTARRRAPITTTGELAEIVRGAVPRAGVGGSRIDPATRTFQGLRIAVNGELEELDVFIREAGEMLRPGGRMVIIAFHSLEDRIVKRTFLALAGKREVNRQLPELQNAPPLLRILTRKPVRPGAEELERNPRSRSARLRAAERV
jgi:16S rRNA (cytosine1402-N4)-methyltransferase